MKKETQAEIEKNKININARNKLIREEKVNE